MSTTAYWIGGAHHTTLLILHLVTITMFIYNYYRSITKLVKNDHPATCSVSTGKCTHGPNQINRTNKTKPSCVSTIGY